MYLTWDSLRDADIRYRLKLKVYRSLGIDLQEDGAAGYSKAVIRKLSLYRALY